MRVGTCMLVQNSNDWDRFEAQERGEDVPGKASPADTTLFADDLRLHDQAEDLNFDTLWTIEHHFTPYAMVTNPVQLLTYFAGRTKRIDLGTMVIVLPWHNPVRVAEDMVMLQTMMGEDRDALIGLGRGLGRREFGGLQIEQDDARGRFVEGVEIIKQALSQDRFSFDGEYFQIPPTSLRPAAPNDQLLQNLRGAWGSPSSIPVVAAAGLKPIIVSQKGWAEYVPDLENFAEVRAENGYEPAKPIAHLSVYCAETEDAAYKGAQEYMSGYNNSALRHYELMSDHFRNLKTYDHYAKQSEKMKSITPEERFKAYFDNHVSGTPDHCFERLRDLRDLLDLTEYAIAFKFGSMPYDVAERSMQLFAKEVLPRLQELPVGDSSSSAVAV